MPTQVTTYCIDKPTCFIEKQGLKQVFKQVVCHYSRHFHTLFVKCYRVLSPEENMRSTLLRFTASTEPVGTVSVEVWEQETGGLGDEDRVT